MHRNKYKDVPKKGSRGICFGASPFILPTFILKTWGLMRARVLRTTISACVKCKVNLFWIGHKILQNLHRLFVLCTGGDFAKFLWPFQNIWTLTHVCLTPMIASFKVEKILKGSLNLSPSPSPSFKIQIMGRKLCLMCEGKTLLGVVNKLFIFKSLLITTSNVCLYISKKFFTQYFKCSLKMKVMGSNSGYLLRYFLL